MKVLILHNQLWTQYKSIIFQGIYDQFQSTDNEILVLQTSICEKSRLNIIDFDLANFNYSYPYVLLNKTSLEDVNTFRTIFLWIKYIFTFKPDVINLTGYSEPGTIFVLVIARILGIKTLLTNESIYSKKLHPKTVKQFFADFFKRLILKLTDGFLSYGIKSNDYLYRLGVEKKSIFSFLNSFDRSKFLNHNENKALNSTDSPYILFVGRLSEEKNLKALIQLAKKFKQDNFNYYIKIVGDGDEIEYLTDVVFNENLPIKLEGAKNWNELNSIYKNSLAFILPSLNETWGMVANEAMEMGVPVICSNVCGCADDLVINDFNGIVVDNFNFEDSTNLSTYDQLKQYLINLTIQGNNSLNIKRIASIYEERRLIDEFIQAFNSIKE
jgi:glycosyltransferase involved in cell wall biosynthesis